MVYSQERSISLTQVLIDFKQLSVADQAEMSNLSNTGGKNYRTLLLRSMYCPISITEYC